MTTKELEGRLDAVRAALDATSINTLNTETRRALTPRGRGNLVKAHDALEDALSTLAAMLRRCQTQGGGDK